MSNARDLAKLSPVQPRLSEVGNSDGALSNRNAIINGDFSVSQRGSFSVATTYPSGSYWADRWVYDTNNANSLISLVDVNVPALAKKTKAARLVAGTTSTTYLGTRQKLEFPEKYAGKTYTYSAWVRSNNANARLTGYFVGPNQIIASAPHSGGGGWERLSVTFTFSSTEASTAYFDAFIANADISPAQITSGDYLEITGVQLEVGDTATPFEHRSYGQELALCQRYFCTSGGTVVPQLTGYSSDFFEAGIGAVYTDHIAYSNYISWPVVMRVAPSVTIVSNSLASSANQAVVYSRNGGWNTCDATTPSSGTTGMMMDLRDNSGFVGRDSCLYFVGYYADAEL